MGGEVSMRGEKVMKKRIKKVIQNTTSTKVKLKMVNLTVMERAN